MTIDEIIKLAREADPFGGLLPGLRRAVGDKRGRRQAAGRVQGVFAVENGP